MIRDLFENNRFWAAEMLGRDPDFFSRLVTQQTPRYLWIGCADSRVAANQIVGLAPGELFVHRNVANLVVHSDLNCLSVLQYAVEVLGVQEIIVCGHYGCGGVRAALDGVSHGLIDNWVRYVEDVAQRNSAELAALEDPNARANRLCELNVLEQVRNVARTTIAEEAWRRGQPLRIEGWIYSLADGLLRDLGLSLDGFSDVNRAVSHLPTETP